ncbi:MAG: AAA family ATPase [Actinomycetota bacterium]|nr:AAA family ATPase [Actinomycetota bacterium]
MIEVRLLGPPRVERDGTLVAFDTRKAMALLAHLAVTERPRPRDTLADLLWPGTEPERARGALRRTLSSLRAAVGAELVEATRDHVRLVNGPGISVDVDRFRELRTGGHLERAVAEFRGDFLEGFTVRDAPDFEEWAEAESERLRRELTGTLSDLASAQEAAGDQIGALRTVQQWLSLDGLHEPAHRALIRLYAATGDRAAALVQYRECVRTLSRELGVSPLTETTQLYEAINRGSYRQPPQVPRTPAVALEPPWSPFVGRGDALRALHAQYECLGTDGRVVLVEGEAGIGKTRLVEELLATLRGDGARVLAGRAYEDETGLAYAPIVDAVRARLRDGADWLASVDGRAVLETARLVPELAVRQSSDQKESADGPGAETRFLAGVWDTLVAAVAGSRPGVLFVDDAQWADDATRGLLSYGLHRLVGRPMLVVLTWRTPLDHRLRRAAAAAARSGSGRVLQLARLGQDAVSELVRAAHPDERDPTMSQRLWETTEGVPLLLIEYLRTVTGPADWPLPTGVRELLRARLDPVSETARQVLAAAAVLGRSFDTATVRAVSGRTDEETVAALEEGVGRGLVREGSREYDFDHELLRTLIYDDTSLARRRLLHGRAADALARPAAVVARHLQLAGREDAAAAAFRDAGEHARQVFAHAEALGHFRAALALGHPDPAGLNAVIGDEQTVAGDYAAALVSLEAAAAASSPAELPAVEHRLGRLQHRRGEYALARAHLEAALVATPGVDVPARASRTADLSLAAYSGGDPALARSLALEARELAEDAGDSRARCQAYNLLGMLATAEGATDQALDDLRLSRELAEKVGDRDLTVAALNNLALAHRARGELGLATELTVGALDLCTALGDRHHEAALHNNLADLLHGAGRRDEAMVHLKAAVEIFAEIGAEEEPRPEIWKLVRW